MVLILQILTHISVIFSLAYVQINPSKSPFSRELMSFPAGSSALLSHWTSLYLSVCLCFSVCLSLSFLMQLYWKECTVWVVYNFTFILRYCSPLYQNQTSAKLTFTRLFLYYFTATKYHNQCGYFILSQTYEIMLRW